MGAENSKSNSEKEREHAVRAMEQAMATQTRMYEERCKALRQAQRRTEETLKIVQNNINEIQKPNNYGCQQTNIQAGATLYPNLNNVNHNATTTAVYAYPSTSHLPSPPNTLLPPVLPTPTAPPAHDAYFATTENIDWLRPPTPSRHNQSETQQATATTSQSVYKPVTPKDGFRPILPTFQRHKVSPSTHPTQSVKTQEPSLPKSRNVPHSAAAYSIVKCVTCSSELGLQIYQCKNGHSSCKKCRLKNAQCGLCPDLITDMRNIMLETHIADIKLKELNNGGRINCPNSDEGCSLYFKKSEIKDHANECPYREMPCPLTVVFGICTWKGNINQLATHFKTEHGEHCTADIGKEMYLLNIYVHHRIVYMIKIGTFHFLVHIKVDRDEKNICMTVQSMSTKFSASKWSYELHVYNKQEPRRKYKFIDTCISNGESVREIFMEKKCAVLHTNYAQTFLDNNRLTYKFYIKKI